MTVALHQNTFWNQLALNGRVITAIVLRETKTKFGRYKFGYAWAFVEPIVYVSLFVLIRAFVSANSAVGTQCSIAYMLSLSDCLRWLPDFCWSGSTDTAC